MSKCLWNNFNFSSLLVEVVHVHVAADYYFVHFGYCFEPNFLYSDYYRHADNCFVGSENSFKRNYININLYCW